MIYSMNHNGKKKTYYSILQVESWVSVEVEAETRAGLLYSGFRF